LPDESTETQLALTVTPHAFMPCFSILFTSHALVVPDDMGRMKLDFVVFSFEGEIEIGQGFCRSEFSVFFLGDLSFVLGEIK
jgi:hypothetical protein